ncbi:MAG: PQQ-binding-like beta-propeller repeat protein [Planctomycetia bacterium]|nr:PQQ-binding-like beta-propeller repeat protein [Planctomycetia bacterium]
MTCKSRAAVTACLACVAAIVLPIAGCGGSKRSSPDGSPIPEFANASPGEAAAPVHLAETDWAGWRGLDRQGAVDSPGSDEWSPAKTASWRVAVAGRGHASPCVVGDRVFLATADEHSQVQSVVCYSAKTGERQWSRDVHRGGFPNASQMHERNTHASCTVASDGHSVFCAFLNKSGIYVSAMDLDGKPLWQKEAGPFAPFYGYANSPAIDGGFVYVLADSGKGGFQAAVDRGRGTMAWSTPRAAGTSYSSPIVAEVAGRRQVIAAGCDTVISYDAATGKEIWRCEGPSDTVSSTPIVSGDLVLVSGGYPQTNVMCISATGTGDVTSSHVKWKHNVKVYVPSMIATGGHLYAVTDQGIGYCWSIDSGKQAWKSRLQGNFSASLIRIGGKLLACNEEGWLFVLAADAGRLKVESKEQIADEIFATPAISGNHLFVRVARRENGARREELCCFPLAAASDRDSAASGE